VNAAVDQLYAGWAVHLGGGDVGFLHYPIDPHLSDPPAKGLYQRSDELVGHRTPPGDLTEASRQAEGLRGRRAEATEAAEVASVEGWSEGPLRLEAPESEARCSFCGKDARQGVFLVLAGYRGRRPASSARAFGSATNAWTCAWRFWLSRRRPEP
jgi:hypothetical protein